MKAYLFLFSLCFLTLVSSCQNSENKSSGTPPASDVKSINAVLPVDDFEKKLNSGNVQLVDVRTSQEFEQGHLKGAVNYNIRGDEFSEQVKKLDKNKPVMVYCMSGGRSAAAAKKLGELGFTEVYNLQGGVMKWNAEGKPLDAGSSPAGKGMCIDDFNMLLKTDKYVLVDYAARWCQPCRQMAPMLDSIALIKKESLKLVRIDADDNKDLLKVKGVEAIPVLELYKDGKLVWKHEGELNATTLVKEAKL
jgi:thioredoxin 1